MSIKTLNDYTDNLISELFKKCGAYFAFSEKQFLEGKAEGVKYSALDGGIICPTEKVNELIAGMNEVYKNGIAQDLAENGKEKIIERELYNHEAFYTWSIHQTVEALDGYGITKDEIRAVFSRLAQKQE